MHFISLISLHFYHVTTTFPAKVKEQDSSTNSSFVSRLQEFEITSKTSRLRSSQSPKRFVNCGSADDDVVDMDIEDAYFQQLPKILNPKEHNFSAEKFKNSVSTKRHSFPAVAKNSENHRA